MHLTSSNSQLIHFLVLLGYCQNITFPILIMYMNFDYPSPFYMCKDSDPPPLIFQPTLL